MQLILLLSKDHLVHLRNYMMHLENIVLYTLQLRGMEFAVWIAIKELVSSVRSLIHMH